MAPSHDPAARWMPRMRSVLFSLALSAGLAFALVPGSVLAAQAATGAISWSLLAMGLFGGIALFLYGMEKLSTGMKKAAGNKMRAILAALTKNRVVGFLVGAFVTMVVQSSSATTVMLVSFVQAELMTFFQALAVILGADIGTTVTAQLIAFKVTDYVMLMVGVGFFLRLLAKHNRWRHLGDMILGFGLLFFGMKLMSDAMSPLRTYPEFIEIMYELSNPMLGLMIGTVFTALIQSSAAFAGIVIVLAQQGLISLEAGIPLILGANVGTCITAGLASIGASREAKRVALAHALFKVGGVLLFIFWVPTFAGLIQDMDSGFQAGVARQIANAHTIFNVSLGLVFLPFIGPFAVLLLKLYPRRPEERKIKFATLYLDDALIETPTLATHLARTEAIHMARVLGRMLESVIFLICKRPDGIRKASWSVGGTGHYIDEIPRHDRMHPHLSVLESVDLREKKIDFLDEKIGDYLIQIARQELTRGQAAEVYGLRTIVNDMESIGDIIHRDILPLVFKKEDDGIEFSDEGREELIQYHWKVTKQVARIMRALTERDPALARGIMAKEIKYHDLEAELRIKHLERLRQEREASVRSHEIHMEFMDLLKQINVYTGNIARTFYRAFQGNDGAGGDGASA